jgi:hypothetical protein
MGKSLELYEIEWPVLCFGRPNCAMHKCVNARVLTTIRYIGLQAINDMVEHFVVDSYGKKFDLGRAELCKELNRLQKLLYRITNPLIDVHYPTVELTDAVSIEAVQQLVCQNIDDDQEFWWDKGAPEELKAEVLCRTTIREIVDFF